MKHPHKRARRFALMAAALLTTACQNPAPIQLPTSLPGYLVVMGPAGQLRRSSSISLTAACPAGRIAVGGGFTSGGNFEARVRGSSPAAGGTGWTVRMDGVGLGADITVTPVAVCASRPSDHVVSPLQVSIQTQQSLTFDHGCPRSTQFITGAGFDVPGADSVRVFSQQIIQPASDTFRVRARSDLVLPGRSLLNLAVVCADFGALPRRAWVDSPSVTVGPGSTAPLVASCPAGTRVTHGTVGTLEDAVLTLDSAPTADGSGWTATVFNMNVGGTPLLARLRIGCVAATP